MPNSAGESLVGAVLARLLLLGGAALISLAPTSEWQSVLFLIAFIALAAFIVVHSHKERRRRRRAFQHDDIRNITRR